MTTDINQLYANDVHLGHGKSQWNPKMAPMIATTDNQVHIINLEATAHEMDRAIKLLGDMKKKNGKVLFVGTKPQTQFVIQSELKGTDKAFYVDQKWSPGLLTNFKVIRERIEYYRTLKDQFATGEIKKYTKKEVAKFKKDLEKLDATFSGVAEMRDKPALLVCLDAVGNQLAIREARKAGVPVVAIVDTNADPDGIDIAIPANDDSIKSLRFIVQALMSALT